MHYSHNLNFSFCSWDLQEGTTHFLSIWYIANSHLLAGMNATNDWRWRLTHEASHHIFFCKERNEQVILFMSVNELYNLYKKVSLLLAVHQYGILKVTRLILMPVSISFYTRQIQAKHSPSSRLHASSCFLICFFSPCFIEVDRCERDYVI